MPTPEGTNCYFCQKDLPIQESITCTGCFYPFCDYCYSRHYEVACLWVQRRDGLLPPEAHIREVLPLDREQPTVYNDPSTD